MPANDPKPTSADHDSIEDLSRRLTVRALGVMVLVALVGGAFSMLGALGWRAMQSEAWGLDQWAPVRIIVPTLVLLSVIVWTRHRGDDKVLRGALVLLPLALLLLELLMAF